MNNRKIKEIVKRILKESVDQSKVDQIVKNLKDSTSQYGWTFGAGTDEDAAVEAIKGIPDLETASAVNDKYNLRSFVDEEFNFDKDDDWSYVEQIFNHLDSLGVNVINATDQSTFDFDFSGSGSSSGGGNQTISPIINNPEKEQEVIVKKGGCKQAPSLESICSGNSYLKNCMKGDSVNPVQEFLISKGFVSVSKTGKVDGIYGPMTKAMVMKYQVTVGLKADGILGPQTISTMGICKKSNLTTDPPLSSSTITNVGGTVVPPKPSVITNPDGNDVVETLCDIDDKQVIRAYNSIKENMRSDDPSFLRRECRIVINYQINSDTHCDNLQDVICFCGTKASSGEDGYAYMGDKKKYLKNYVSTYCKSDFTQDETQTAVLDGGNSNVIIPGCATPGSVISILQQEDDEISKDDCMILFSEAVNWYNSWKKCERKEHSANPSYKAKCFSCLNKFNFNWKDLGSGENKVVKMYGFNKREINKKQRRELPRMESIEALNRALLMMNYDMNKTLTENKEIITKNDKTGKRI
jgi:peptidoglycan hydrolase-like protein with peptidoglycan-binding domain